MPKKDKDKKEKKTEETKVAEEATTRPPRR